MNSNVTPFWKWALPLSLLLIVVDQTTKTMVLGADVFNARACLQPGATAACGKIEMMSLLDFTMVWNYGISFGLFQSDGLGRWLLLLIQLSVSIGFAYWVFRADRIRTALALSLVIGGAIGNVIDRLRFWAVVDFMDMSGPWFGWRLPAESGLFAWIDQRFYVPDGALGIGFPYVYNVADMGITFGALLLLVDQVLAEHGSKG